MKIYKVICTLLVTLIIFSFFNFAYANANINENTDTNTNTNTSTSTNNSLNTTFNSNENTNEVRALTLQEQEDKVKEELANANSQLEYVQSELSTKMYEIQNLEDRISQYEVEFNKVNSQYKELQSEVSRIEKELEEVQREYNRKDRILKKRLVELYKQGSTTYIDVLFGSKDIIEFVSNYFMISKIAEYDNKNLEEIKKEKQRIEKANNELQEKKAKMKLAKNNAAKQQVILTNTKTILESEKSSLDSSEQVLLAKIESYRKQQEEINYLISKSIYYSTYELQYSGGIMQWPTLLTDYITSPFGSRLHPIQGIVKSHDGIDIGGSTGDPVYAAQDGIIIYYGWMGGYGNAVMIDHGVNEEGKKIVTLYGHGNKFIENLSVGTSVKKGDLIMEKGSTGNSTGPHVHFEVRENGIAVDPKKYLSNVE